MWRNDPSESPQFATRRGIPYDPTIRPIPDLEQANQQYAVTLNLAQRPNPDNFWDGPEKMRSYDNVKLRRVG
jgi:hypothetical protein